jgi:tetratricopeptide (TPR) repeat protein
LHHCKSFVFWAQTLKIGRRVLGGEHPAIVDWMYRLALVYFRQGRYDEAEPLLAKTFEVRRRSMGEENVDTLCCMGYLASVYFVEAKYEKAEPMFLSMLDIQHRTMGSQYMVIPRRLREP